MGASLGPKHIFYTYMDPLARCEETAQTPANHVKVDSGGVCRR